MKMGSKHESICQRNGWQTGKSQKLRGVTLREAFSILLGKTGINNRAFALIAFFSFFASLAPVLSSQRPCTRSLTARTALGQQRKTSSVFRCGYSFRFPGERVTYNRKLLSNADGNAFAFRLPPVALSFFLAWSQTTFKHFGFQMRLDGHQNRPHACLCQRSKFDHQASLL